MRAQLWAHARATLRMWHRSKRVSTALGATRLQRLWLRVVPVALLWAAPIGRRANRGLPVAFTYNGKALRCVLGEVCEYQILEEIFVDEVYEMELPARATIVDLGANVGISTLYFLARRPDARVLVVEPNPAVLGRLRRNVGHLARVTIAPVAVADRDGEAHLSVPGASWTARLGDGPGYSVPTVTLDSLLARYRLRAVDVVKFDIEGAEFGALSAADLSPVGALVGELHPERSAQMRDLSSLLEQDFRIDMEPNPDAPLWLLRARRR